MTNQDVLNFLASRKDAERPQIPDLASYIENSKEPIIVLEIGETLQPKAADTGSFLSGHPCREGLPLDKNGVAMTLFGQLDFAQLCQSLGQNAPATKLPISGILRVFITPNYRQFREKDTSWFKVLFSGSGDSAGWQQALQLRSLEARTSVYLPIDKVGCSQYDHNKSVENGVPSDMSNFIDSFNEHFVGSDYILGEPNNAAMESRVIAAFYANGISYDDKRRNDSCYRHLVEEAASWRVLWKSGRVSLVFPEEKRELYICIRSEDLQNGDFGKSRPVFF